MFVVLLHLIIFFLESAEKVSGRRMETEIVTLTFSLLTTPCRTYYAKKSVLEVRQLSL